MAIPPSDPCYWRKLLLAASRERMTLAPTPEGEVEENLDPASVDMDAWDCWLRQLSGRMLWDLANSINEVRKVRARLQALPHPAPDANLKERAAIAREAKDILGETVRLRWRSEEAWELWSQAAQRFHQAIDTAYPPGFWDDFERLSKGDVTALESAVAFLEADPWFFRSGYIKGYLIRYINRIELPPGYADRLRRMVLSATEGRQWREFRAYCRLARKLDSPELRAELTRLLDHPDPAVRRRARWALDACEKRA
jgi:hypothetical protein